MLINNLKRNAAEANEKNKKLRLLVSQLKRDLVIEKAKYKRLARQSLSQNFLLREIDVLKMGQSQIQTTPNMISTGTNTDESHINHVVTSIVAPNLYEQLGTFCGNKGLIYMRQHGLKSRGRLYLHIPEITANTLKTWNINSRAETLSTCLNIISNSNVDTIASILIHFLIKNPNVAEKVGKIKNVPKINVKLSESDSVDIIKRLKLTWMQYVLMKRFLKSRGLDIFVSTPAVHREIQTRSIKTSYSFHSFQTVDKRNEPVTIPAVLIDNLIDYVKEAWENILLHNMFVEKPEFKNFIYIGMINYDYFDFTHSLASFFRHKW